MNRVSIRTLVLMLALLAYFVAYQCLAFIPPAKTSGTTRAVRPAGSPQASASVSASEHSTPAAAVAPQPASSVDTSVAHYVIEADGTATIWYNESPADPNDPADPNGSGGVPEIVE